MKKMPKGASTSPDHKVMHLDNKIDRKGAPKLRQGSITRGSMTGKVHRG